MAGSYATSDGRISTVSVPTRAYVGAHSKVGLAELRMRRRFSLVGGVGLSGGGECRHPLGVEH